MKKINLVAFLFMSCVLVAQDLTVGSGGSISIPQDSYVFIGGNFDNFFEAELIAAVFRR